MEDKIDFVIIWVDGNDTEWRKEKNKYAGIPDDAVNGDIRFRDWDILKYWFRSVEKFAPWVNNVYFVTCGHYPEWLNLNNPKLKFIKHSEYIPEEFLPTFSSHTIELNLHRIKGLSEKFVFFNDDMFLTSEVEKTDFFVNNMPKRHVGETVTNGEDFVMPYVNMTNTMIINNNFNKKDVIKRTWKKYFSYKYGFSNNIRKLFLMPFTYFSCFTDPHLPSPMLKSTFEDVWEKEENFLKKVSNDKFRQPVAVSQSIFKLWDICKGNYCPADYKNCKYVGVTSQNCKDVANDIRTQKYKQMCLNDVDSKVDFERIKKEINDAFESILPEKSNFEL